ncbi:MAG: hypothetical protein ACLFQX_09855 [Candidatus Kapaibacterium sp.]
MNTTSIKPLIERYFEGDTSLAEEALLREYFDSQHIDPELEPYSELFRYMTTQRDGRIESEDFDERTISRISRRPLSKLYNIQWFAAAAAACAFIMLGVFFLNQNSENNESGEVIAEKYATKDPEIAYKQAVETLGYVSGKLNESIEPAKELSIIYEYQTKFFNISKVAL